MDHYKLVFVLFGCDNLKRNLLKIIPDEYNSLADISVLPISAPENKLKTAVLDHVQ